MVLTSLLRRNSGLLVLFFSLWPFIATAGCAAPFVLERRDVPALTASDPRIRWFSPVTAKDGRALQRWRTAVGPPLVRPALENWSSPVDEVTIVSWNTALGAGDVPRFAATLPPGRPMVLLLQEVYRRAPEVPGILPRDAAFARRQGGAAAGIRYAPIEPIATALGLSLYYVPSMRNGSPEASSEDRGNAILSSLPLEDLIALELPFERQRRVAAGATISGRTSTGLPWRLRLVTAHLDNTFNPLRLSLASEYGRTRQARGLLSALDEQEPLILGGDFNTWSGFSDQAYRTLARRFPVTRVVDRRATFRGWLRLDHLFFRLAPGWTSRFRRADERFGSDHYPLVGSVRFR
jgi:endonuclease/exonuclease/phosphatase family metal-dependent hydrolase